MRLCADRPHSQNEGVPDPTQTQPVADGAHRLDGISDAIAGFPKLVAALLSALALAALVRGWWRTTLGRRRDLARRLARLGTAAQEDYFTAVLGSPPALRKTESHGVVECIWIFRDAFVQGFLDSDHTVVAYSVTTRSHRFHPRYTSPRGSGTWLGERWFARLLPPRIKRRMPYRYWNRVPPFFDIKLGKSRFSDIAEIGVVAVDHGVRTFHYEEEHYFGNPGHYQTYAFGTRALGGWTGAPTFCWPPSGVEIGSAEPPAEILAYRKHARILAILIVGLGGQRAHYPPGVGPHPDSVRTFVR
jgi:hypothetical protein